jgi:hypothetical protein
MEERMSETPPQPKIDPPDTFLRRLLSRWRGKALQVLCLFLFFLCAGLFVFANCPPLWRDYDGLIQISNRPGDMTVLQYPAAYPFFSRMHVWAAQIIQGRIHHKKTPIHIGKTVILNDAGINALILSQQTLFALALTAFVRNCARSRRAQWVIAILLVSNASLFVITNLISTEALAQVLVVAFVALGFRLFQVEGLPRRGLAAYGLCLYVSILTRHTNSIFAMLLPMACLFRIAMVWIRERKTTPFLWMQAAVFISAGFTCIAAANLTTRLICRAFDVPYRSISARATSERLGFVDRLPPQERADFIADLEGRADDPVVKEAIPILARTASWVHQRDEIQKILLRDSPSLDERTLTLRSDAYLDRVASLFFRSRNHQLVQETLNSMWRGLAETSAARVAEYYLKVGEWSVDLYASDPGMEKRTHGLASCSIESKNRIIAFAQNPWLKLWSWAPHGAILLGSSILALIFLFRKIGSPLGPLFALATAFTAAVATCLTFVLVNYIPRFTCVADLFAFLTLAMVAAHGVDAFCLEKKTPPTAGPN